VSRRVAIRALTPGSADVDVHELDGRRVVLVTVGGDRGGALSSTASETVAAGALTALDQRLPFVCVMSSSGADINEGVAALDGWGRAARAVTDCSGIVPVIVVTTGGVVAGPALLLGLADMVVMTKTSYAFVSGTAMVAEFTGIDVSTEELGGSGTHARTSGVAAAIADDLDDALAVVSDVLRYVPDNCDSEPALIDTSDPSTRATDEAGDLMPDSPTGSYDVRHVIGVLVDDGYLFELRSNWAPNIVTGFAAVDGRPVGIVGNQPLALAGTLDIPASQKAARFVAFCDAFNLPIITFVDTPGFYPGKDLEWRGMIRHGAQLVYSYGRATVPRICVILRKSYGGAYIVMDSKRMGNDLCFAWPWAELAVMGAGQASAILMRRATPDERADFEVDYTERLLNPYVAAERGYVDAVIEPGETRSRLAEALAILADKRETLAPRKHGNTPL
jgi:acetyl-CoA carboxylase carboxyltransferase component